VVGVGSRGVCQPNHMISLLLLLPTTCGSMSTTSHDLGARNQRLQRAAARDGRIATLLGRAQQAPLDAASAAELRGLLRAGDTYDSSLFTPTHGEFKAAHNACFIALAAYCSGSAGDNVFYLDGADGRTSLALCAAGVDASRMYTANWHAETCAALCALPQQPAKVVHARAEDALRQPALLGTVPFAALYLDMCGGATAPVVSMIEAVFSDARRPSNPDRIAVGFTLTAAEPTGRALADREVDVARVLAASCRPHGYTMSHVADEPERYGVEPTTSKREGVAMTTWLICTR